MEFYKNLSLESMPYEVWKDVVGWEGLYSVSNVGRVRSHSRLVWSERDSMFKRRCERILKQKITKHGYLGVTLFLNKQHKYCPVHILVCKAFIENPENKPQVNHKWGIKKDNRVGALEWATAKENSNHAIKIGIDSVVGEHNGRVKLTEEQVREIRMLYPKGKRGIRHILAEKYNITAGIVTRVALRQSWKHI